jgi:alpha-2-macroglobulin
MNRIYPKSLTGLCLFLLAVLASTMAESLAAPAAGTLVQPPGVTVIPDKFLRRWDPVTFFLDSSSGPAKGGPEHHPERFVSLVPAHPGVYTWIDAKTLQFRPAEPWPALSRFSFKLKQKNYDLVTLMEVPTQTIPADREEGLDPIERITLTFAEALDPKALRQMLRIGVRPLPGIDESQTRWLDQKDFDLKVIERVQRHDPASYVLSFGRPIPSGQRVIVRLRLSLEDSTSDSFKDVSFTTSESFRISNMGCAELRLPVTPEGVSYARDQALTCGADRRQIQVEFSAPPKEISPVEARNLVRFTPAVKDLTFEVAGRRLLVDGNFQTDTLYRVSVMPLELFDMRNRPLLSKAASQLYLYFPPKPKYLQSQLGQAIIERFGPQQLPLAGRGFERVDLRIYPLDPLNRSFWPFPEQPVLTEEQNAPPAPGEEPEPFSNISTQIDARGLTRQLRALGSPPLSTIVKLPLRANGTAARFGLDLEPHLATISGKQQPGTYLVGVRKLDESAQRSWTRIQVTDLTLTTIDEEDGVKFAVNSLSTGAPVSGAEIRVEGSVNSREWKTLLKATSGSDGTYRWSAPGRNSEHTIVRRIVVQQGRDILVLDPTHQPDSYADNLWSKADGKWLQWTQESFSQRSEPAQTVCHVFSERPVYRPEEKVYLKGYVRQRHRGVISLAEGEGTLVAEGPGGLSWRYPIKLSAAGSFNHTFEEASAPTGTYRFHFEYRNQSQCGSVDILKEAYRTPEFDLRLSAPDQVPLDREFKVQLAAQYYAGGQAAGRPVRWRVTQFPYTWTPASRPGFFYSSDGRFSGREGFRGSAVIEHEGTTDEHGGLSLTLNPAIETTAQPRSYVIEATVTGADDQTVSATQRVLALPAVVLGLKTPRYIEHAKSVKPEIIVVGPDGALVANHSVTVRLIKREWHSHLRADDFTQAEPKYVTEVVEQKISEKQVKSSSQPLAIDLALEGAGVYVVELETLDRLGRSQKVAVDLYAGGDEPVSWSRRPSDVFKVTPDKASYAPGETAHLIIESPFQQAHGLAIIETPDGNRYQWFTVKGGAASFDVVVQKNFVPRIPLHFVLMRGRIPGVLPVAGGRVDLGKPATVAATSWLTVEPVEHQVTVQLKHLERARPGDTVDVTINLAERGGKPAAGEVTLWLVDQAVLALGKEQRLDPVPDFITPVHSRVSVQDTRNWTLGILPLSDEPGGDGDESEASEELLDKVTVRKDFQSVPYFNPNILIGSKGTITVRVKLPDNLTNFKLRAKAVSGADRFGVGTGQISVRLPVIVQPALPRFVRPGDKFTATAIGRIVEGEGGAGSAEMRAKGVDITGNAKRALNLKLNEAQRIEYQVSVPTPAITAQGEVPYEKVSFTAAVERSADKARDAFEVLLPIRADRVKLTQRQFVEIKAGGSAELAEIAEAVRAGSLRRTLVASDQPALVKMAAGLNVLLNYPHGCTEQKLSKARAFIAFKEFNARLYRDGQDKELKRVVADVLSWLPSVIDNRGLVSYWPGSNGYVSLSAWVTEFLVEARNAGFTIDQPLFDRLITTLQQALRSDYTHFITGESYTERVMALRALAAAGRLDNSYVAELSRRTEFLNLEASAQVLRLLDIAGNGSTASRDALSKKVWDGVVIRSFQGREIYGGLQEKASSRNGLILPSETRTLAEVVRASAASQKADPRLTILTDALVTLGQDNGWGSTQADASAMLALSDYLKRKNVKGEVQKLAVTMGAQTQLLEIGPNSPIVQAASNSPAKIVLRSEAKKPLIVRAETSYLPQALGSQAAAGTSGFVVSRESLRQRGAKEPADKMVINKPGTQIRLSVGDVVEEHVEVISNIKHNYVAIVVPLAAGVEPLNPKLATAPAEATPSGTLSVTPSYVAYLDDQVTFYYDELPKGAHHFYFRTRATIPGQFTQPQARAELMYDAAVHGESAGAVVEVTAKEK